MSAPDVQLAIVDEFTAGYADGVRDKRAGMLTWLDVDFHGTEYVRGYETGAGV